MALQRIIPLLAATTILALGNANHAVAAVTIVNINDNAATDFHAIFSGPGSPKAFVASNFNNPPISLPGNELSWT